MCLQIDCVKLKQNLRGIKSNPCSGFVESCIMRLTAFDYIAPLIMTETLAIAALCQSTNGCCSCILLILKAPNKNCSRQHFNFIYLSKKIRLEFSCESSSLETSSLIFSEKQ